MLAGFTLQEVGWTTDRRAARRDGTLLRRTLPRLQRLEERARSGRQLPEPRAEPAALGVGHRRWRASVVAGTTAGFYVIDSKRSRAAAMRSSRPVRRDAISVRRSRRSTASSTRRSFRSLPTTACTWSSTTTRAQSVSGVERVARSQGARYLVLLTRSRFDVYPPVNASPTGTHSAVFVPNRPARVRGNTKGRPAYVWLSDENGGCPLNYARMVSVESEMTPIMVGAFAIPDNQVEECLTQATTEPNGQPRRRIPQQNHNPTIFKNLVFTTWYRRPAGDRHLQPVHPREVGHALTVPQGVAHVSDLQGRPDLLGGQRHGSSRGALHRAPCGRTAWPRHRNMRAMPRVRTGNRWTAILRPEPVPARRALHARAARRLTIIRRSRDGVRLPDAPRLHAGHRGLLPAMRHGARARRAIRRSATTDRAPTPSRPSCVLASRPAGASGSPIQARVNASHIRDRARAAVSPLRDQSRHDSVSTHPSGAAAGWHLGHRCHAAEGRLLQGAVGLSSSGRSLAAHRAPDRDGWLCGRSRR